MTAAAAEKLETEATRLNTAHYRKHLAYGGEQLH
jgi:hypothetical protein